MPQLYSRHRKECEAGRPEDSKSGQFEEGRIGWKLRLSDSRLGHNRRQVQALIDRRAQLG